VTIEGLHHGFEAEWGWWVSSDLVRRVYSSFSLDDAVINWRSLQAAPINRGTLPHNLKGE
jgi:hypothetical protein